MEENCVSFFENPDIRCPNPHQKNSVFCEIHSRQHLRDYLRYKKLEEDLVPVQPGQSVKYYLHNYAKFSRAHDLRLNFREEAIAHSARDIGHQIRLDWLWLQLTLCVRYLEKLFATQSESPVQSLTPKEETRERTEFKRIFNVYTKTKKRVDDYEEAIKEAIKANAEALHRQLQEYLDNISKLVGPTNLTIHWLINLGQLIHGYSTIVDIKRNYKTQMQSGVIIFQEIDDKSSLIYAELGYLAFIGPFQNKMPDKFENSVLATPEGQLEYKQYIDNLHFLTNLVNKIDKGSVVVYLSSKILRTIHVIDMCYIIIKGQSFLLSFDQKIKQPAPLDRSKELYNKGTDFTDEQLAQFDFNLFIKEKGQLEQLITWRKEYTLKNFGPEFVDKLLTSRPDFIEAMLISDYYIQALVRQVIINYQNILSQGFVNSLDVIPQQLNTLTNVFSFPELIKIIRTYQSSGIFRREIEDLGLI